MSVLWVVVVLCFVGFGGIVFCISLIFFIILGLEGGILFWISIFWIDYVVMGSFYLEFMLVGGWLDDVGGCVVVVGWVDVWRVVVGGLVLLLLLLVLL